MAGIVNSTLFGNNVDFRGVNPVQPTVVADGQLLIGATVFPNIRVGNLTSLDASVSITNGPGSIDLSVSTSPGTLLSVPIDAFTAPGTNPTLPTGGGSLGIFGAQVASGTTNNVIRTHSTSANNFFIEVQRSASAGASNQNLNGVSHFNSAHFSVDAGGFVSLSGGGEAIDSVGVDAFSGPGTNPVLPDINGKINVTGAQVASGGVGANVVRTNSVAANTYTIEIQRSTTNATPDSSKNGVSHYNSSQFSVDSAGFVSLSGGSGAPVLSVNVDSNTAPGTDPVLPNGSGIITVTGGQVASGTVGANVIRTNSLAANTYTTEIQRSTAVSSADSTKNGVSHFDNLYFTCDSAGFVQSTTGADVGVTNIGFTYNSGTGVFTVCGSNGTALSAANPGYVRVRSNTNPGLIVQIPVTSNVTFIDSIGASQIINNLFGLTAGVPWVSPYVPVGLGMPFYLYALLNTSNNAVAFAISRMPNIYRCTMDGKIGTATSDSYNSFWGLSSGYTLADYTNVTNVRIGWFSMDKTAGNDWTVNAFTNLMGNAGTPENLYFGVAPGHFGAAAGNFFSSTVGGDTVPKWGTNGGSYNFRMKDSGTVLHHFHSAEVSVSGVGTGNLIWNLVYPMSGSASYFMYPGNASYGNLFIPTTYQTLMMRAFVSGDNKAMFLKTGAAGTFSLVTDFSAITGSGQAMSITIYAEGSS